MRPTQVALLHRLRLLLPYALLTVVFASGLIALDRIQTAAASSTVQQTASTRRDLTHRGVINMPACGDQLGIAGYTVTLTTAPDAAQAMRTSLKLGTNDEAAEFLPLTASSPALQADTAAQAVGLDRTHIVKARALGPLDRSAILAKLTHATGVGAAEPIWLQSTDKKYLACDYKLRDNATDQALAATARQALVAHGISAGTLDDAGTMEFVSLRHFNGRLLLQVAFVQRPVNGPSAAYVALLNPGTHAVQALARANWYLWG